MPTEGTAARLDFGSLLTGALQLARRRWGTLFVVAVSLHWAPVVAMGLSGTHRYDPWSHNAAAFTVFAFQTYVLAFCDFVMQLSVMAVGLGSLVAPISASQAVGRVLRHLPVLALWGLLWTLPTATSLCLRWSANTYADFDDSYWWRQISYPAVDLAINCVAGLFPLAVLAGAQSGLGALRRAQQLMAGRRRMVVLVVFAGDVVGLLVGLATPYATSLAVHAGLGHAGWYIAAYAMQFAWDLFAVIGNLLIVQLFRELERAHDGVAMGEVARIFA